MFKSNTKDGWLSKLTKSISYCLTTFTITFLRLKFYSNLLSHLWIKVSTQPTLILWMKQSNTFWMLETDWCCCVWRLFSTHPVSSSTLQRWVSETEAPCLTSQHHNNTDSLTNFTTWEMMIHQLYNDLHRFTLQE